MATILRADGTREVLDPGPKGITLDVLQGIVGGYIEFIRLGGTATRAQVLIINEDGLRLNLPVNETATQRVRGAHPRHRDAGTIIVGDVVEALVCDGGEDAERIV